MKTAMLGVGLMGLVLFAFGCAAEVGAAEEPSKLTIDGARISRSGQQFLVEGTSHGQPISQLTKSVLVESDSGNLEPWQENSLAGITCYSCTSENGGGTLKCVRVPCPDEGIVGVER
jgi:hypothetical protein